MSTAAHASARHCPVARRSFSETRAQSVFEMRPDSWVLTCRQHTTSAQLSVGVVSSLFSLCACPTALFSRGARPTALSLSLFLYRYVCLPICLLVSTAFFPSRRSFSLSVCISLCACLYWNLSVSLNSILALKPLVLSLSFSFSLSVSLRLPLRASSPTLLAFGCVQRAPSSLPSLSSFLPSSALQSALLPQRATSVNLVRFRTRFDQQMRRELARPFQSTNAAAWPTARARPSRLLPPFPRQHTPSRTPIREKPLRNVRAKLYH